MGGVLGTWWHLPLNRGSVPLLWWNLLRCGGGFHCGGGRCRCVGGVFAAFGGSSCWIGGGFHEVGRTLPRFGGNA